MKTFRVVLLVALAMPSLGLAKNQLDNFELRCTSEDGRVSPHTFHLDISDEGKTTVSEPSSSPATYEAEAYVNAFVWEADGVRYVAERFRGELTTFPDSSKWQCTKVGGKKF